MTNKHITCNVGRMGLLNIVKLIGNHITTYRHENFALTLRTSWSCFRTACTSSFSSQLNSSSYQTGWIKIHYPKHSKPCYSLIYCFPPIYYQLQQLQCCCKMQMHLSVQVFHRLHFLPCVTLSFAL